MSADPKIIDIISQKKDSPYVSLEYFPPRSAEGVKVRGVTTCRLAKNLLLLLQTFSLIFLAS